MSKKKKTTRKVRTHRGKQSVQLWVRIPVAAYREIEEQAKKHFRTIPGQVEAMLTSSVEPLIRVRKLRKQLEKVPRPLQPEEIERTEAEAEDRQALWRAVREDLTDAFLSSEPKP